MLHGPICHVTFPLWGENFMTYTFPLCNPLCPFITCITFPLVLIDYKDLSDYRDILFIFFSDYRDI